MAQDSKIEWCNHTANLWWGCTHVHTGCDNCYAEYFSDVRYKNNLWGSNVRKLIKKTFNDLDKFQRIAAEKGEYHRVFIGSMMDIFEKSMPLINPIGYFKETNDLRQVLFTRIRMGLYDNLILLLLTKRPSNIPKMIPGEWMENPPINVMYGTSVSEQDNFNTLVPQLLRVPGKHFISMEPQVEFITLARLADFEMIAGQKVDWIIQGGESGHRKRPFDLRWAYEIRNHCETWGIPYFFKQIDKVQPIPDDLMIRQFP